MSASAPQTASTRPQLSPVARPLWIKILALPLLLGEWLHGLGERNWHNVVTALIQIGANKARAVLTTLGIIIAVTSTIIVISFVEGFGNYVTDMLRGFGSNMVIAVPYTPSGSEGRMLGRVTMDINDIREVGARCDKVHRITPLVFSGGTIEYGREKADGIQIRGATEQFQTIRKFFVEKGRFFSPIEIDRGASVCVLGHDVLKHIQADEEIVGQHVYINETRFLVLGLLEEKGSMMGMQQDEIILIPYTTAVKMTPYMRYFMPFIIEASSEEDVEEASLQVTRVLRERHNLRPGQPNDFRLLRQDMFLKNILNVKRIATGVLGGIVSISLIVGGIGIMNVMLISVSERTREIGLRKSIGARRRDVLLQFLTEAVVLATVGGMIGIALSYAACAVASMHPKMVNVSVPLWSIALALGFSAGVGVFFGLVPAFKAAIIHPIDALRHE